MIKMSKVFALALAVVMVFSLVACGSSTSSSTTTSVSSSATSKADVSTTGGIDTSKFVTVDYYMLGDAPTTGQVEKVQEKWNSIMKEKINANMNLKWIEWADWSTKYNLLLASGEPVDLVTAGTDWLDTWANAQKGAFKSLDEMLPKYAPNLWAEVPPEDWEQCKYNGKIVMIPEDHYTQWVNHGFMYRGDWAKEFGITTPIKDFDTLGKYLQGVKDKKPGVTPFEASGAGGTAYLATGYILSNTNNIQLDMLATSLFYAKSYDEKYTVTLPVMEDNYITFAKLMKDWSDKGFWHKDQLNYKGDAQNEMLAGKNGVIQHHTNTYKSFRTRMDREQAGSDLQFMPFANDRNLVSMTITHGATCLGVNSNNPERALMVYDLIRSNKDVYRLLNYGLEGVQYVEKDGRLARPDGYNEKKDQYYSVFWGGRLDKFELMGPDDWAGITDLYKQYDAIKKPYPYGRFVFNKQPIENELSAVSNVFNTYDNAIALGQAGDPVKAVEGYRTKLKAAGIDKIVAELQKQLDDYKKLVESK